MKKKGFTLVEVILTITFVAMMYIFVVHIFWGGYRNITVGDITNATIQLAQNKMTILTGFENPIYIGLDPSTIEKLKQKKTTPFRLYKEGKIKLGVRETISVETNKNSEELRIFGKRVDFKRTVDWLIEEIDPLLVHIWVRVEWSDPTGVLKGSSFEIETLLVG